MFILYRCLIYVILNGIVSFAVGSSLVFRKFCLNFVSLHYLYLFIFVSPFSLPVILKIQMQYPIVDFVESMAVPNTRKI
jgi:hypothetical protein